MSQVGVVGASARAAVHSLARAGLDAWAIDLFADRDLARIAPCAVCPSERYPDAIPELAKQFPPGPVLYTGGLENYPHVVRALASERELRGTPPEVLEHVRDPFTLFPALAEVGVAAPRLIPANEPCPTDGRWLRKPLRSGGGLGIRFAAPGESASPHHYFQEFLNGVPMSAIFVNATLFGVTEQLVGEPWLHAKPFAYCGNVGPVPAPAAVPALGEWFCARGVRGVWGVDFLLVNEAVCVLEVNPRYTAAVEVIEHVRGLAAWGARPNPPAPFPFVGKAIYYAPRPFSFPHGGPWDADLAGEFDPWRLPEFADIPHSGAAVEAGSPVLTFFAEGNTPSEVRERLQSRAAELDHLFRDSP